MKKSFPVQPPKKSPAKKKSGAASLSNHHVTKSSTTSSEITSPKSTKDSFPIVAIGASAGGLEAVTELLKHLPPDTGMAFIYVQHLSPEHESMLASLLSKSTKMKVQETRHNDRMEPNNVYVVPPDKEMFVADGHIELKPRPKTPVVNLPIDIFFTSLAEKHKEDVIGIILSGSATDGTRGMKAIKFEGGLTFAQDDSAKFTSMPQSAIAAGAVDFVLSPKKIALELARLSKHPYIKREGRRVAEEKEIDDDHPDLKSILRLLHKTSGVDFYEYKINTIKRRILRRMLLYKISSLKDYAKLLREKNDEPEILYRDLLINVTDFFRDGEAHQYLKTSLLPKLLKSKKRKEPLRIWVPACASGQEAYSIAIELLEIQGSASANRRVHIFATDLDSDAISKARIGLYSKQELESVSPKRLQRYFTKSDGGYRIAKAVRDMCVFAPHNILSDPPFVHVDLISCCNVFIYLDTAAQKRALAIFHYALNQDGYLLLGKSETIGSSTQFFTAFNKKYKIYSRKKNTGPTQLPVLTPRFEQRTMMAEELPAGRRSNIPPDKKNQTVIKNDLDTAINAVLISQYTPASVVINHQLEILQFRGSTDLYLSAQQGKASLNILKMTRPEVAFELRTAISRAIKTKQKVRKAGIEMKVNAALHVISLEVIPVKIERNEPVLLILFTEGKKEESFSDKRKGVKNFSPDKDRRIKRLEEDLAAARADLIAYTQEQEAFNEELQSANEEVVSSNEELQSVNEELETSKEEIESANEELSTTNQELQTRNELLNESYEYSEAIITTMHDPMVILDKELRVKSANKSFYKKFGVKVNETEGVLFYDLVNKQWNLPLLRELLEDIIPKNSHFYDFEVTHSFPGIGEKVMLLNANRIIQKSHREQLILLAISDITEQATARKKIEESEKKYKDLIYGLPIGIYTCDAEGNVELFNETAVKLWGRNPERGKDKWCGSWKMFNTNGTPLPHNECPMAIAVKEGRIDSREIIVERPDGTRLSVIPYPQPVYDSNGKITGAVNTVIDITSQAEARKEIEESEKQFHFIADSMPQKVWTADDQGNVNYFNKTWLNYTGLRFEELKDWGWKKIIHPDDWAENKKRWQHSIDTGNDFELEHRFLDKDGEYKWHLSRALAYKDEGGKIKMWVGTNTEIHEQKKQKEELEKAILKRTYDLQTANESLAEKNINLEQMNKELESFAYVSSHDLQEPLRKIQTLALRIIDKEKLSESGKEYFDRIQAAASRMRQLIRDLLSFSQVNIAERKFEMTDLKKIVEEVKIEFKDSFAEKHAVINSGEMCDANIIPFQFRQLMQNLIGNALRFSKPGIPPHITIKSRNVTKSKLNNKNLTPGVEYCHISIEDNGIGFEQRFSEQIFEVFKKLHGKSEYDGTGIGLAIVKKIVENHNGTITATSELNKGARFDIYIPV